MNVLMVKKKLHVAFPDNLFVFKKLTAVQDLGKDSNRNSSPNSGCLWPNYLTLSG